MGELSRYKKTPDPFEEDLSRNQTKIAAIDETILKEELNLSSHITGRVDSLRNTILSFIAEHKWDLAIRELRIYRDRKVEHLEVYRKMSSEHFRRCVEAIRRIQTLLAGVDLKMLPLAKRQDIYDKVVILFENVKSSLNSLESVENDIKVRDLHATIMVMKVGVAAVFSLAIFAGIYEAVRTLTNPIGVFVNDITTFIFGLFGS